MIHLFVLLLVYLTPVDGAHPAGADGQIAFFTDKEACIAAAKNGVATMRVQADALGEKILGGVLQCQQFDIPLMSEMPPVAAPERPSDDPIENQNRI